MRHPNRAALVTLATVIASISWSSSSLAETPTTSPTTSPATRPHRDLTVAAPKPDDDRFDRMHRSFVARAKQGDVDLLFLGDSITAGWESRAKELFDARFGRYRPANFGIGGDHVYSVLWRIENGELDGIRPKVVVLMIGTNDTGSNTGEEIAHGIEHLVGRIRAISPATKVLVMSILPRGPRVDSRGKPDDGVARMAVVRDANARLAKLFDDGGVDVRVLDIGPRFVGVDGKIPADLMPDQLHPSLAGYQIWTDAIRPVLEEMMR